MEGGRIVGKKILNFSHKSARKNTKEETISRKAAKTKRYKEKISLCFLCDSV
jgi:hypothetical protein